VGRLLVAATPIGNLSDISQSLRSAIESADAVACEDTRVFGRLCMAISVKHGRLIALYEHNERDRAKTIADMVESGNTVLLVSNAGTPLMSDPGFNVVREAVKRGLAVSPIPGPCSAVAALSCSGLRTDRFAFAGFPPRKCGKLARFLEELSNFDGTVILFESPQRIAKLVNACAERFGPAPAVVARELTKMHEEFLRGNLQEISAILESRELRGECILLIENRPRDEEVLED
jgi:16S rRNA (cytidine1402-2'-O)-methyltransferase